MHVFSTERSQPGQHTAGFSEVNQVIGPAAIGTPAHAQRQPQCRKECPWPVAQHLQHRLEQRLDPALQDIKGFVPFGHVLGIHQLGIPAPQGNALHLETLAFQRQDLATNEAMADLGVLIDEVSDAHRDRA